MEKTDVIALRREDDVLIAEVLERRIFLGPAEKFREQLLSAVENAEVDVIVDLHTVSVMNSSALGALILANDILKKRGRTLFLASPGGMLRDVLQRMKLDTLFVLCDTLEEARSRAGGSP